MRVQKYVFAMLISMFVGVNIWAQCLTLPNAANRQLLTANKIIEGKVVSQQAFLGADGNIYTANSIEVYRVFKGNVGFDLSIVTEGGIYGDLMQMVTPSAQMQVGDYGVMILSDDAQRSLFSVASAFYPIDENNGTVYGFERISKREDLYDIISHSVGTGIIELRRIPLDLLGNQVNENSRLVPEITSVSPLEVTAGTQTVLTIVGQGFGETQNGGYVAFRNADDGGQSFVNLQAGPHYLSWSDNEIQMFVPSATLYNSTVAGTGVIRVVNPSGTSAESTQQVMVDYAKSEVIYSQTLNETMLVGMQNGGYEFSLNERLSSFLQGTELVANDIEKWACNTGVNFRLGQNTINSVLYAHDGVNLLGLSQPGQLPSYLLGKTVTTFSSCGTPENLQWNMIEVDILLNADIDWSVAEQDPTSNQFDLSTAVLHELGHAHLLQHNINLESPMYFQLTAGSARRQFDAITDVGGGEFITSSSVNASSMCNDEYHQYYDFGLCDLSVINGVEEELELNMSVYPNPFKDQLSVRSSQKVGNGFAIIDAMGRTVLSGVLTSDVQVLQTADLASGFYLLQIMNNSSVQVIQLVKN